MVTYIYREDSGHKKTFAAANDAAAEAEACGMLRGGDYGPVTSTLRLHAHVSRPATDPSYEGGDWSSRVTTTIEPSERACTVLGSDHNWQSGQALSHGGGVVYTDTCANCGLERTTDTWATCRDCGETYTCTSYSQALCVYCQERLTRLTIRWLTAEALSDYCEQSPTMFHNPAGVGSGNE